MCRNSVLLQLSAAICLVLFSLRVLVRAQLLPLRRKVSSAKYKKFQQGGAELAIYVYAESEVPINPRVNAIIARDMGKLSSVFVLYYTIYISPLVYICPSCIDCMVGCLASGGCRGTRPGGQPRGRDFWHCTRVGYSSGTRFDVYARTIVNTSEGLAAAVGLYLEPKMPEN